LGRLTICAVLIEKRISGILTKLSRKLGVVLITKISSVLVSWLRSKVVWVWLTKVLRGWLRVGGAWPLLSEWLLLHVPLLVEVP
jgi:hypothetical protein